jgi:hypothetical protein
MSNHPATPPPQLLEAIANLSHFHREHELFYAQAPLRIALDLQANSRALKALADRWTEVDPHDRPSLAPFTGAEDLNAPGLIAESGILFMESEGEPTEITKLKDDLESFAESGEQGGEWLARAMEKDWEIAGSLVRFPQLVDLLGERHRIIAHDMQSAFMQSLAARELRRALDLLGQVDFSPRALRENLAGARTSPVYLYTACELIDHAADLCSQSATLTHENERRWRVFSERVRELRASAE